MVHGVSTVGDGNSSGMADGGVMLPEEARLASGEGTSRMKGQSPVINLLYTRTSLLSACSLVVVVRLYTSFSRGLCLPVFITLMGLQEVVQVVRGHSETRVF
jgi:hypothetical protein